MSSKFFNNEKGNTLINEFEGVLKNNDSIKNLDAVVGFFRSSGYFSLRPFLDNINKVRILIGISTDRLINLVNTNIHLSFPKEAKEDFFSSLKEDIYKAPYTKEVEDGLSKLVDDLERGKLELRIHPSKRIHAKLYVLYPDNYNEHSFAATITGSSNLTDAGLGLTHDRQYEFNVKLTDYEDVNFSKNEFERLWNEASNCPVDACDLICELKKTHLQEITPYELYMKVLIEYFGSLVEDDFSIQLPSGMKDLRYQHDAVVQGYQMLMKHNGFILADVVGLGKTYIATMIVRRFVEANGRNTKVLIVCPPALKNTWLSAVELFSLTNFVQIINNGSLKKILKSEDNYYNPESFDLVLVDEAHNFRNDESERYDDLQKICKTPRSTEGHIKGPRKKILLLSATPLNNRPEDLLNLLLLFQDSNQSTLDGINDLNAVFVPWNDRYKKILSSYKQRDDVDSPTLVAEVDLLYEEMRNKVLNQIVIRRTRNNIKNISSYNNDLLNQGIKFPEVLPPIEKEYNLTGQLNELFYRTLKVITNVPWENGTIDMENIYTTEGMYYARYRAVEFLTKESSKKYKHAEHVATQLTGIFRVVLVKRLESSFYAFKRTLRSFLKITQDMIKMYEMDNVVIAPDLNIKNIIIKGQEAGLEMDAILAGIISKAVDKHIKSDDIIFHQKDFKPEFIEMLKCDAANLEHLCNEWEKIDEDPKLDVFVSEENKKLFFNDNNPSKKLVVFSESVDTVNYLYEKLREKWNRTDVLKISADNRKTYEETIKLCFDANIDEEDKSQEYNIIITSDVLSEGINLHQANVIVNYDSPWNATRLMQRIGRVNRIGSKADNIYNYLFYPSKQGDKEIHIYNNALVKLQGFHSALGEDAQIFSTQEVKKTFTLFNPQSTSYVDKTLNLLEEVKILYQNNRSLYNKIKKLPVKCRTLRRSKSSTSSIDTVVYMSSNVKSEFYWISDDGEAVNIPFLKAADLLCAEPLEKGYALTNSDIIHFEHVNKATKKFLSDLVRQNSGLTKKDDIAFVEVKGFLKDLIAYAVSCNQTEGVDKLKTLLDLAKQGVYTSLNREIRRISRLKKTSALVKLNLVIDLYSEYKKEENNNNENCNQKNISLPLVIVSETIK